MSNRKLKLRVFLKIICVWMRSTVKPINADTEGTITVDSVCINEVSAFSG